MHQIITNIIVTGLIYSVFVLAIVLTFRIIGFADLTIEGSFSMGGAIIAMLINSDFNPVIGMLFAFLGGAVAGFATAALHCFLRINKLLSGIITLSILFTVNIRIMGRPNFPILNKITLFDYFDNKFIQIIILLVIAGFVFLFLYWLLSTKFGLHLRTTGENSKLLKKSGYNPTKYIIIGLVLSNGFIALSGSMLAQIQGFSDINMSGGLLITVITSLLVGEKIIKPTSVLKLLFAAVTGAFIFQFVIGFALKFNINPWDLKLLVALLFIIILVIEKLKKKTDQRNIGADFI
ncbi:MAG: hypothetical protein A2275_15155 [Bacteroidetes bacterium RIFOXYA12_FULL_35_11]|nr:MAG: hypothetical protein A2X01_18060 [Bacteroidetes bacterium GWF2_35_48]OFY80203.1 MAG: hypothetical protein A2275_15155 [Bacteroidetes bacterium RIFOXYA12_FULL_35_11]OFY95006.1 MAG: hypothetical protein A2491_16850 [Bacteroidetes bacterium RIFOXYC12_FULL_35_7]HBX51716.1 hypothetical protein [Bacteroidales bacterium]